MDPERRRHGFALLTVVLGLSVVTVLVSASISRTATHVAIARQVIRAHADAALAEGVVLIAGLVAASRQDEVPLSPLPVRIAGRDLQVEVLDTRGLVDVNTARPEVLAAALPGLIGPEGAQIAEELALRRTGSQPWTTTRELVRLGLVDHETFAALQPYLTVWSGRPDVRAELAPERLRPSLPDQDSMRSGSAPGGRLLHVTIQDADRQRGPSAAIKVTSGKRPEVDLIAVMQ